LVSEKIKFAGLAVMSNLVILVQTELTEGLWEVVVKTSWAGQLVVQGIFCPACIEHVDNNILSFIRRVMARGLIFFGNGGNKILPVTFDAVRRDINLGNDFVWYAGFPPERHLTQLALTGTRSRPLIT